MSSIVSFQDVEKVTTVECKIGGSFRNDVQHSDTRTISASDESNEASVNDAQGDGSALNQNVNDLQGVCKLEESSLSNTSNNSQHVDIKFITDGAETTADSAKKCPTHPGESESKSENSFPGQPSSQLESGLCSEKKTDFQITKTCTDASQIIADVVESIEQESAPPVAPPRRKRKKKKSTGDTQVSITYLNHNDSILLELHTFLHIPQPSLSVGVYVYKLRQSTYLQNCFSQEETGASFLKNT